MAILVRDIFNDENVVEQLDALYKSCSVYFQAHGMSSRWAAEDQLLQIQMDPDRRILGVLLADSSELIGAVDVKLYYPSIDCVTIGSILFRPEWRGKGFGTETLREIERRAIRDWKTTKLEIAVSEHANAASYFLAKNGFKKTERHTIERRETEPFEVVFWEKYLQVER
ncbi:MAG: GNAT family N-acetyltransferase [Candidatus Latescibacteria bacterium]|nr:GNAT family N-acetyltransferase [Candidatus Latescibacterota bacterium]